MSITLYVSCKKAALPPHQKWQESIQAAGFDLKLDKFDWRTQSGFLPVSFMGDRSGFELMVEDAKPVAKQLKVTLPPENDVVVSFVFGSEKAEGDAAACASAALAQCTGGLYFDEFSDDLLDGQTAVSVAQDSLNAD